MDLSTTYLGMKLKNPIVPSASPLSRSVSSIAMLEDAGASAVVLYLAFEEELNHESERWTAILPKVRRVSPKRCHISPKHRAMIRSARIPTWSISTVSRRRWRSRS